MLDSRVRSRRRYRRRQHVKKMDEKGQILPVNVYQGVEEGAAVQRPWATRRVVRRHRPWPIIVLGFLTFLVLGAHIHLTRPEQRKSVRIPVHAEETIAKCRNLKLEPGPAPDFHERKESDRFVDGTKATLIKNATIWTGRINGFEIIKGDILLDKGTIKAVGHVPSSLLDGLDDYMTIDAQGSWVSPG